MEKGPGVTSFQVVAHLRRVLRAPRIGHGGTLDPAATGVLPILIGEATKLTPYLVDLDKEYVATVRLGVTTETQDLAGAVLETRAVPALDAPALEAALAPFVGIQRVPPMFSALRRGGKRLTAGGGGRGGARPRRGHRPRSRLSRSRSGLRHSHPLRQGYLRAHLAADVGAALGWGGPSRARPHRVGPTRSGRRLVGRVRGPFREGSGRSSCARHCTRSLGAVRLDGRGPRLRARAGGGQRDRAAACSACGPTAACSGWGRARRPVKPERLLMRILRDAVLPA